MTDYTTEADIEILLGFSLDSTTTPSSTQVDTIIDDVSAEMDAFGLGRNYDTTVYIDVVSEQKNLPTIAQYTYRNEYLEGTGGLYVIPPKTPIITISNLWVNESDPGSTASWTAHTEGPASGASFVVLRAQCRNKLLGYALYFFEDIPDVGRSRIKMNILWGWDMDTSILKRYATLKAGERVLQAKMSTNAPDHLAQYVGGEIQQYIPAAYGERLKLIREEIKEMEASFPMWMESALIKT